MQKKPEVSTTCRDLLVLAAYACIWEVMTSHKNMPHMKTFRLVLFMLKVKRKVDFYLINNNKIMCFN